METNIVIRSLGACMVDTFYQCSSHIVNINHVPDRWEPIYNKSPKLIKAGSLHYLVNVII